MLRTWCALRILTWKCASRHNSVHFFDISTSKSGPSMVCFVHFDFEMRFSLTACTFSTSQLPKRSEREVLLAFPLANVLRATTACNFSRSHPARWLRTRRSSEPTFQPPGATNHWKNIESRLFYLFARLHLLFYDSFSSLICILLLFSSLTLTTSAFPSVHIVGSLTSKLPPQLQLQLHYNPLHYTKLGYATLH